MKNIIIIIGLIVSFRSVASDSYLLCNDQNSHSVYELKISENLNSIKLTTLLADSSVLSSGSKTLNFEEGESTPEMSTFGGKTNSGLGIALLLDSRKASNLKSYEILEVNVFYQKAKGDILSGNTLLLCSKK